MTETSSPALAGHSSGGVSAARSTAVGALGWRSVAGFTAIGGGGALIAGCLLPWASTFAGLISYAGISGTNGRILAATGAVIIVTGICHLVRGADWSRWTAGLAGFAALGYSGLLLIRLSATVRSLSSNDMVILRGGPGLWVAVAGSLAAFATLFLPSSAQRTFVARTEDGGGLAAWAADRESAGTRRLLQVGLGVIWLLDAALQFQPFMFGRGFVTQVVDPAGMGSPAAIANTVNASGQVILAHPALFNAGFATVQLLLALCLFWRPAVRAALAGTIVWALAVWWLGEAFGGIFSGMANPFTGAPGAALLYALIAVLAWPRITASRRGAVGLSAADESPLGRFWARVVWVVVWGGFAALMVQPQVLARGALSAVISGQAAGEPGWLSAIDRAAAGGIGSGGLVSVLAVVLFAVIAAGILLPTTARPVLVLAGVLAIAIWLIGENLGGLTTGSATDPNTGPLLLLLIVAFWPRRSAQDEAGRGELAGGTPELERDSRPQPELAALAVQPPTGGDPVL